MKAKKKTKTKSKKLDYLVAIRAECGNEIFSFENKRNRSEFIKDIQKLDGFLEYATTEIPKEIS